MLLKFCKKYKIKLFVLHINHNISINSNLWQKFCKKICLFYNVYYEFRKLEINFSNFSNLEETLRLKRYLALKELCIKNNLKLLFTAHHKDDQIETILLRIFRGSGILGISGMHEISYIPIFSNNIDIFIIRPFLNISKIYIKYYAKYYKISFINDELNNNNNYRRNFIRNKIIPKLLNFFPGFKNSIIRILNHSRVSKELLKILANYDFKNCIINNNLNILKIRQLLNNKRIDNLLYFWLKKNNLLLPSKAFLKEFRKQLINLKIDSHINLKCYNSYIRSYRNYIYLTNISDKHNDTLFLKQIFFWRGENKIYFPNFKGILYFNKSRNRGLSVSWLRKQKLFIRLRKVNDKIKLYKKSSTKKLKKYYQNIGVPVWKRNFLPIISLKNNEIIYAACIGINYLYQLNIDPNNDYILLYWENFFY